MPRTAQYLTRFREAEYSIGLHESANLPELTRLTRLGYCFTVLRRVSDAIQTFSLASNLIRTNGKEFWQNFEVLTPQFSNLNELEEYLSSNLLSVWECQYSGARQAAL